MRFVVRRVVVGVHGAGELVVLGRRAPEGDESGLVACTRRRHVDHVAMDATDLVPRVAADGGTARLHGSTTDRARERPRSLVDRFHGRRV